MVRRAILEKLNFDIILFSNWECTVLIEISFLLKYFKSKHLYNFLFKNLNIYIFKNGNLAFKKSCLCDFHFMGPRPIQSISCNVHRLSLPVNPASQWTRYFWSYRLLLILPNLPSCLLLSVSVSFHFGVGATTHTGWET